MALVNIEDFSKTSLSDMLYEFRKESPEEYNALQNFVNSKMPIAQLDSMQENINNGALGVLVSLKYSFAEVESGMMEIYEKYNIDDFTTQQAAKDEVNSALNKMTEMLGGVDNRNAMAKIMLQYNNVQPDISSSKTIEMKQNYLENTSEQQHKPTLSQGDSSWTKRVTEEKPFVLQR